METGHLKEYFSCEFKFPSHRCHYAKGSRNSNPIQVGVLRNVSSYPKTTGIKTGEAEGGRTRVTVHTVPSQICRGYRGPLDLAEEFGIPCAMFLRHSDRQEAFHLLLHVSRWTHGFYLDLFRTAKNLHTNSLLVTEACIPLTETFKNIFTRYK